MVASEPAAAGADLPAHALRQVERRGIRRERHKPGRQEAPGKGFSYGRMYEVGDPNGVYTVVRSHEAYKLLSAKARKGGATVAQLGAQMQPDTPSRRMLL